MAEPQPSISGHLGGRGEVQPGACLACLQCGGGVDAAKGGWAELRKCLPVLPRSYSGQGPCHLSPAASAPTRSPK